MTRMVELRRTGLQGHTVVTLTIEEFNTIFGSLAALGWVCPSDLSIPMKPDVSIVSGLPLAVVSRKSADDLQEKIMEFYELDVEGAVLPESEAIVDLYDMSTGNVAMANLKDICLAGGFEVHVKEW
jgi:hypothetical protein